MLFPVGPQPPSVYWRRRLFFVAGAVLVVLLLVLTTRALLSSDGSKPQAAAGATSGGPSGVPASTPAGSSTTPSTTPSGRGSTAASSTTTPLTSPAGHTSSLAPPPACAPSSLRLAAVVAKPGYAVGAQPVLGLQVTNTGPAACVQDVADSQIELRVYNGASRVWGSHDCQIQPGQAPRTFNPGQPAVFTITWSGLTSQPNCAGTRQRVGIGTYTLYASLAGHQATAAQFTIS